MNRYDSSAVPWYGPSALQRIALSVVIASVEDNLQLEGRQAIPYSEKRAFDYATGYCDQTNVCGTMYKLDCAHFMAHCLAAGGINIAGSVNCPHRLCVNVEELAAALHQIAGNYSNVAELSFDDGTRRGDYGFFLNFLSYDHSFLLNAPVEPSGKTAVIFGHTYQRCGRKPVDDPQFLTARYYRITPT